MTGWDANGSPVEDDPLPIVDFAEMDGDAYIAGLDKGRAWPMADNE